MTKSPKFPKLKGDNCQWYLRIQPNDSNKVSIFLVYEAGKTYDTYEASVKFSIENINNIELYSKQIPLRKFDNSNQCCSYFWFASFDTLITQLVNDILIVKCCVKWTNNWLTEQKVDTNDSNQLSNDFEKFINEKSFSDVTLMANDGIKFSAHKCILAARSPVFAAMFSSAMRETHESIVKIEDMDADTLRHMLEFIYACKFNEEESKIDELLAAADKYDLKDLKLLCEKKLIKKLSVDNAAKYLLLAHRHNDEDLKRHVVEIISKNLKKVLETDAMIDLAYTNFTLFYNTLKSCV